jgi:hypothetical protein
MQHRRIATLYDKLAANYLATIKLACIRIWLRAYEFARQQPARPIFAAPAAEPQFSLQSFA